MLIFAQKILEVANKQNCYKLYILLVNGFVICFILHRGYKVADFMETVEFLAIPWTENFDSKLTIEDILKAYEENGFDANQDGLGNARWEELYDASPKGTKVILTVRDNEEVWHRK